MKIIRFFVVVLMLFGTTLAFAIAGFFIGAEVSPYHDIGALGHAVLGAMIGMLVGAPVGILFASRVEKQFKARDSGLREPIPDPQAMLEKEITNPDIERLRVERYGSMIVVCSSCGTKNSTSYSRCLKCSKDLSVDQPIDNPYIV